MSYAGDDDWRRQEALRHLPASEESVELMLNGMVERERLDVWMEVAKELDVSHQKMRLLREHRTHLNERNSDHTADEEDFRPASEVEAEPTRAVADGGAEVEGDGDDWEPREGQTVMEYEGPEQRGSLKDDLLSLLQRIEDAETLHQKLEDERDSDELRPHAIDALQERLTEVEG